VFFLQTQTRFFPLARLFHGPEPAATPAELVLLSSAPGTAEASQGLPVAPRLSISSLPRLKFRLGAFTLCSAGWGRCLRMHCKPGFHLSSGAVSLHAVRLPGACPAREGNADVCPQVSPSRDAATCVCGWKDAALTPWNFVSLFLS